MKDPREEQTGSRLTALAKPPRLLVALLKVVNHGLGTDYMGLRVVPYLLQVITATRAERYRYVLLDTCV